jgi:pimeloyl-ACP methyl ester carboxylesterase
MSNAGSVLCMHGLWMPRAVMLLVRHRLRKEHRFDAELYGYPTLRHTLDENAETLAEHIAARGFGAVHLVGHSLGGIVAMRMLALYPDTPVRRLVCLGSPLRGCRSAAYLDRTGWGKALVGKSLRAGAIDQPAERWAQQVCESHDVGVIAGTRPLGLGRLAGVLDEEGDGTVTVSETRLPGIRDHICLPVSHTGLALSTDVADQVAAFLKRGEFLRE